MPRVYNTSDHHAGLAEDDVPSMFLHLLRPKYFNRNVADERGVRAHRINAFKPQPSQHAFDPALGTAFSRFKEVVPHPIPYPTILGFAYTAPYFRKWTHLSSNMEQNGILPSQRQYRCAFRHYSYIHEAAFIPKTTRDVWHSFGVSRPTSIRRA